MHPSWFSAEFNPLAIWSLLPAMCTAWSGKWKLSVGFSIFFFFFLLFLQTRMHEVSREHWLVCDIMLLVHIQKLMHRKSKMPLGKDPVKSVPIENHCHSNLWGLLVVTSNMEDNHISNPIQIVNNCAQLVFLQNSTKSKIKALKQTK